MAWHGFCMVRDKCHLSYFAMRKLQLLALAVLLASTLTSCKEHYSDGEKVGTLIEFAKSGLIWDSWDGRLNLTQTGMNTAGEPFQFSFDNDREGQDSLINLMQQAQVEGWKIKIKYHRVMGWNWFENRGRSDYFVDDVVVLDKNFANIMRQQQGGGGRVVDTVYVVIDKAELRQHLSK